MINPFIKNQKNVGPVKNPENYIWLKSIEKDWVIKFEVMATYIALASIPLSITFFILSYTHKFPIAIPSFLSMNIFLMYFTAEYFKQSITCPKCGYNPSQNKDRKLVRSEVLRERLFKLKSCPSTKCKDS